MAKIYYGPIVSNARGKVAGVVFSVWKGVSYAKRWAKPTYTNTTAQQEIRASFSYLTQLWKYLSFRILAAWTAYAKGKAIANRNAWLGENTKKYRDSQGAQLVPHNPEVEPLTLNAILATVAGKLTCKFAWNVHGATGDKALFYAWAPTALAVMAQASCTYPATVAAITGLVSAKTYNYSLFPYDLSLTQYGMSVDGREDTT